MLWHNFRMSSQDFSKKMEVWKKEVVQKELQSLQSTQLVQSLPAMGAWTRKNLWAGAVKNHVSSYLPQIKTCSVKWSMWISRQGGGGVVAAPYIAQTTRAGNGKEICCHYPQRGFRWTVCVISSFPSSACETWAHFPIKKNGDQRDQWAVAGVRSWLEW